MESTFIILYMATWGIWNVDMEAYDESIVDCAQNKWRSIANGWHRKRNNGHSQKSTEEMVRSYPWHDSLLSITLERRIQGKTKNNVLGLVIEDGGKQYQLWWTKDVGTRQIKMVSVKMEWAYGQNCNSSIGPHDFSRRHRHHQQQQMPAMQRWSLHE